MKSDSSMNTHRSLAAKSFCNTITRIEMRQITQENVAKPELARKSEKCQRKPSGDAGYPTIGSLTIGSLRPPSGDGRWAAHGPPVDNGPSPEGGLREQSVREPIVGYPASPEQHI